MTRPKNKSGHGKSRFVMLPHDLLNLSEYMNLSHKAKSLLTELVLQYNGKNNGDLCIALSVMKKRGWNSNDTIRKAMAELIETEFIIQTRQGGRNQCNLYALTWIGIDECKNKLEIPPSSIPRNPLSKRIR